MIKTERRLRLEAAFLFVLFLEVTDAQALMPAREGRAIAASQLRRQQTSRRHRSREAETA